MWEYREVLRQLSLKNTLVRPPSQEDKVNELVADGFEWFVLCADGTIWMRREVADRRVTSDDGGARILADAS